MIPAYDPDYNSRPAYLRELIERAGLSQQAAARQIGVDGRTMRYWLADPQRAKPPYTAVFALECLARQPFEQSPENT